MSKNRFPVFGSGNNKNLLVYVNPGFNTWHGHYLTQLKHIERGAQSGFYDLIHLANANSDENPNTLSTIIPYFDFKPEVVKYGTEEEISRAIIEFETKLQDFLEAPDIELRKYNKIRLYQFTGHPGYSLSYERVIGNFPEIQLKAKAVNNFLYRNDENEWKEGSAGVSDDPLEISDQFNFTLPVVDSLVYFNRIKERGVRGVSYLPFPFTAEKTFPVVGTGGRVHLLSNVVQRVFGRRRKRKVVYMGYPHSKWGYSDVYNLYRKVVEELGECDFEFHVRHQDVHGDAQGECIQAEWLKKKDYIVHYEGFLSVSQYYKVLENADIVLLPYDPKFYRIATSGVFVEAVLAGAVVISSANTWMANELTISKCGRIYEYGNTEQFVEQLLGVRDHFEDEKAKASAMVNRYQKEFSIEAFAKNLFQTEDLEAKFNALLLRTPEQDPIYLPTERLSLEEKVIGLTRVVEVWENDWKEVYQPRIRKIKKSINNTTRCFIIGNGPSLNKMDLELLKGEVVFAANGFYMLYDRISWRPDFYFVEDHLVAEDHGQLIPVDDGSTKFFPIYLAYAFEKREDIVFYNHRPRISYPHGFDFSLDASLITYTGCTVLFSCLQFAFYFGFKEIYLLGVDLTYQRPDDLIKTGSYGVPIYNMESDDPNHFHKDYFGKGFRWHEPQEEKMADAFKHAESMARTMDVRITNLSVGGNLNCFPRMSFTKLLSK